MSTFGQGHPEANALRKQAKSFAVSRGIAVDSSQLAYGSAVANLFRKHWKSLGVSTGVARLPSQFIRPITDQTLYQRCRCLAAAACIDHFSPHDLLRTFAGDMLDAGADVALVQQLMGHSSVATTVGYDRRSEAARRAPAGLVGVPYDRRRNRYVGTAK
jgi:hypothetical protein